MASGLIANSFSRADAESTIKRLKQAYPEGNYRISKVQRGQLLAYQIYGTNVPKALIKLAR